MDLWSGHPIVGCKEEENYFYIHLLILVTLFLSSAQTAADRNNKNINDFHIVLRTGGRTDVLLHPGRIEPGGRKPKIDHE